MFDNLLGLPYNWTEEIFKLANNLSSGLEDYLEAIYISRINYKTLKGADLARKLDVSRASVSEALSRLVSKGLVSYNSYECINLTESGVVEAEKIYGKHRVLKDFFEVVLGIPSYNAEKNACRIEHIISEDILHKMKNFTKFFKNHKKILEIYMEESEN